MKIYSIESSFLQWVGPARIVCLCCTEVRNSENLFGVNTIFLIIVFK